MRREQIGLVVLAVLFIAAGSLHLIMPQFYIRIMPPYLPAHKALVLVSGICEMLGGVGLLAPFPQIRHAAAWGLVALLIAVFPANIYMVAAHASFPNLPVWALWLRLPLQLPLIAWAWLYTRG